MGEENLHDGKDLEEVIFGKVLLRVVFVELVRWVSEELSDSSTYGTA